MPTKRDSCRIQAAGIRFLRRVKCFTRSEKIHNDGIRNEVNILNLDQRIENHKQKWKEHIDRMDESKLPRQIRLWKPTDNRKIGKFYASSKQLQYNLVPTKQINMPKS